jgi:hypothetical protein
MRSACGVALVLLALGLDAAACSNGDAPGGACAPGDTDGLTGGSFTFALKADDAAFVPAILKAQNVASITLTLTNTGTKPHDFVIDCAATPNGNGCPQTSCFGDAAKIAPVAPGGSATATFATPNAEGIYVFRSDLPGDTQTAADGGGGVTGLVGQFIVQ